MLVVSFTDAATYELSLVTVGDGEPEALPDIAAVRERAGKAPLLVMACGYGVITKDTASAPEITAKVMAPGSGFVWSADGVNISFVREAQMEPFAELSPLAVTCGASAADAEKVAVQYYATHVRLRELLRPSPASSALALLLARRIQLPVLGVVLLLLVLNAAVSPQVRNRREAAETEMAALQKRIGKADDTSRGRAQAVAEWGRALPRRFGWLCDRAATVLPKDITLTSLSVQPLLKNIEEGRKPLFSEREMVISGRTPRSESVSDYVTALGGLQMAQQVRLSSVEYDREKGFYNFRINLEL